ncbi:hypothetical protein ACFLRZ_01205 [Bacteroidota bacterium]
MKYIFCYILIILFFFSCKKEDPLDHIENKPNYIVIDTLSHSYNIKKYPYETIGSLLSQSSQFDADINNDRQNDLRFWIYFSYSPGGVNIKKSGIEILNLNTNISIVHKKDTTCSYKIQYSDSNTATYWETYDPSATYSVPITLSIKDNVYPRIYNHGDTISLLDEYVNYDLELASNNKTNNTWLVNNGIACDIQAGIWNNIGNHFIGCTLIVNQKTFLGWLKLKVVDTDIIILQSYAFSLISD